MHATRTFDLRPLGIDGDVTCEVVAAPRPTIVRVPLDQHHAACSRVAELIAAGVQHLANSPGLGWQHWEAQRMMESAFIDARRIVCLAFYVTPSMVDPMFASWVRTTHSEAVAIEWARPDATGSFWPTPKQPPSMPVHLSEVPKLWRKFQRLVEDEEYEEARRLTAITTPEFPSGFYVRPSDCPEPLIAWIKVHVEPHIRDGLGADVDENGRKVRDFFD